MALLEGGLCVVDELLAEHGQHIGEGLDEGDADFAGELGVPGTQVFFEEVVQFAAQLHTGRTTADDDLDRNRQGMEFSDRDDVKGGGASEYAPYGVNDLFLLVIDLGRRLIPSLS